MPDARCLAVAVAFVDADEGYTYLKNLNISEGQPYSNDKCIIRRGIIVTSQKNSEYLKQYFAYLCVYKVGPYRYL